MAVLKRYNDVTAQWETVVVGKQGPSGVVGVTAPITNSGTDTNAVIGIDQTAITVDQDQVTGLTTGTSGYTALSNGTAGITYQPVSHNYIINGAFDVWQRGTAFAPTTDTWTADRWEYRGNRTTASVDRVAFSPADIEANGFGDAEAYLEVDVDASGTFFSIAQLVEDVRTLAGQTVTLSFWAKASSATTLGADFRQYFGGGGSSVVTVPIQNYSVTTSWQRFSLTYNIPSVAGKTITTASHLEVRPIIQVDANAYTIDIWGVQLEAGSVATPFKRHAPSLQGELAACQRFAYQSDSIGSFTYFGFGYASTTTQAKIMIPTPTDLRVKPTSVPYGGNIQLVQEGVGSVAITGITQGSWSQKGFISLDVNVASGLTVGQMYHLRAASDATAFIRLESEL